MNSELVVSLEMGVNVSRQTTPLKYTYRQYFKNIFKNVSHFVEIFNNPPPLLTKIRSASTKTLEKY